MSSMVPPSSQFVLSHLLEFIVDLCSAPFVFVLIFLSFSFPFDDEDDLFRTQTYKLELDQVNANENNLLRELPKTSLFDLV
jgi:hypothetical protein